MKISEGDYYDLITYIAGLFGIKKLPEVSIDKYRIKYGKASIVKSADTGEVIHIDRFPEKHERDRIKSLSLEVSGITPGNKMSVDINWDYVEFRLQEIIRDTGMQMKALNVLFPQTENNGVCIMPGSGIEPEASGFLSFKITYESGALPTEPPRP